PLEPGLLAATFAGENRIIVNEALRADSLAGIAALLAHEAYHAAAQGCHPPFTPSVCHDEELAAYSWEASVYRHIPADFRGAADLDRVIAEVERRWEAGQLQEWVTADPYYRRAYFPLAAAVHGVMAGLARAAR
ncbi:MAG: hypothetical protein NTZ05_18615, partial [Chloroflexi bacterium]|nr:hypothetical protein [Chloroflexota bacterium]